MSDKNFSKIKKFLLQRDYGSIDTGLELLRSLNDPSIFSKLLSGCAIDEKGKLVRNSIFNGTGPAQPFLDYALWNIIGLIPDDIKIDSSLIKKDITKIKILNTTSVGSRENGLTKFPIGIYNFSNLIHLDLSHCSLPEIPKDIIKLPKIKYLSLSNMPSSSSYRWSHIKSKFNFEKSFVILAILKKLEELDLSSNDLFDGKNILPDSICLLKSLKKIDCSDSDIEKLPNDIGQLSNLEVINLHSSKLNSLPPSFTKLTKLQHLDLGSNCLKSVPENIGNLVSLRSIDLSNDGYGNPQQNIENIPRSIGKLINLNKLNLENNGLKSIPSEIGNLLKLEELQFRKNSIKIFPKELSNLKSLKIFNGDLDWTSKIQTEFDLGNPCTEIASEIFTLPWSKKLKNIDLSNGDLTVIPKNIYGLKSLEKLSIKENNISIISEKIGQLSNLINLDLSGNGLKLLNQNFKKLKKLQCLDLSSNPDLKDVSTLSELSELKLIMFDENNLNVIPKPSKKGYSGREKVKTYQRRLLKEHGRPIPKSFKSDKPKISSNLKSTLVKLRKFFKSKDFDIIDQGIELTRSLNDPRIYSSLLNGWSISDYKECSCINNTRHCYKCGYSGILSKSGVLHFDLNTKGESLTKNYSDKTWTYFSYTVWNLIGYADQNSNLHPSLYLKNIHSMTLDDHIPNQYRRRDRVPMIRWPKGVFNFKNLTSLNVKLENNYRNPSIEIIPDKVSSFINLKILDLNSTGISSLPNSIGKLTNLEELYLASTDLTKIPTVITSLTSLKKIDLNNCRKLVDVDGLSSNSSLIDVSLDNCSHLKNLNGLAKLKNIEKLNIDACFDLENIEGISNSIKLVQLDLSSSKVTSLDPLLHLINLIELDISACKRLQNIDGLLNCKKLESLIIHSCTNILNLDGLLNCKKLEYIKINSCSNILNLDGLVNARSLKHIDLLNCDSLENIGGLRNSRYISSLDLSRSTMTFIPKDINKLKSLTNLFLSSHSTLNDIKNLKGCSNLSKIDLSNCELLINVDALANLKKLKLLNLSKTTLVKPKPSPVNMITKDMVSSYQQKIKRLF